MDNKNSVKDKASVPILFAISRILFIPLVMFPAYTLLRDKNDRFVPAVAAGGTFMSIFVAYLFSKGIFFF